MRYCLLVVCLIGTMTAGAYAQTTWKTDFDGNAAATVNNRFDQNGTAGWHWGWDNLEIPANGHSYDATKGIASAGAGDGGALKLLDDELPGGYMSSHLAFDVGERQDGSGTVLKAGGVVVARVQYNSASYAGVGFGYGSTDGNHNATLGLQSNSVSIAGWLTGTGPVEYAGSTAAVPGGNAGKYRTYALGWGHSSVPGPLGSGTMYNVWMLNEGVGNWSNTPADWTQIVTNLKPRSGNHNDIPDANAIDGGASGIQLGSFGPGWGGYGRTASGDLDFDWIAMRNNTAGNYDFVTTPWMVDYTGIPVPEPTALVLLGVGFCVALRRRVVR